ncbi:MAG: hypothetical protein GXX92_01700 [Clostridiales bacterium]|nr:hypothetical protein [Clostridiales bacterium]
MCTSDKQDKAYEKLKEICEKEVEKRYRGIISAVANHEIDNELDIVKKQGSACCFIEILDVLNAINAKPCEFLMKGPVSLITYCIGISEVEPLVSYPSLYPELYFGISGERFPCLEFSVTKDLYYRLIDHYRERQKKEPVSVMVDSLNGYLKVFINGIDTYNSYSKEHINTISIGFDSQGFEETVKMNNSVKELCVPKTYEEHVKCYGFLCSVGAWENNAEVLIKNRKAPFSELIADREGVYEYLINHGINESMSYKISEAVRTGTVHNSGWSEDMLNAMEVVCIPSWFIESCKKINYLPSRAYLMDLFKRNNQQWMEETEKQRIYVDDLNRNWEETVERLSSGLSYEEYVDAILLLHQSTGYIITGFESHGDFRMLHSFNFNDMEGHTDVIFPNRVLTEEEERFIEENYKDCSTYDYINDDRSFVVFSLYHDHGDKSRIIPRLRPAWDRIQAQFDPINRLLCYEENKLRYAEVMEGDNAGD